MKNRRRFIKSAAMGLTTAIASPYMIKSSSFTEHMMPRLVTSDLNNSFWYLGQLLSIMMSSEQTNGSYALIREHTVRGFEPPPHTHTSPNKKNLKLRREM